MKEVRPRLYRGLTPVFSPTLVFAAALAADALYIRVRRKR